MMLNSTTAQRQRLIEAIQTLPDDALTELIGFIGYLQYRSTPPYDIRQSPLATPPTATVDSQ